MKRKQLATMIGALVPAVAAVCYCVPQMAPRLRQALPGQRPMVWREVIEMSITIFITIALAGCLLVEFAYWLYGILRSE